MKTFSTVRTEPSVLGGGAPLPSRLPSTDGFSLSFLPSDSVVARFKKHIPSCDPIPESCWEWTGCVAGNGYGCFWDGIKRMNAHRFSYGVFIGQLAEGLMIMHVCDNKLCVNPYHLRQGTASQNARDAVLKGRMAFPAFTHQKGVAKPQFRGELNGRARLAAVDIPRIRKLREIGTKLAAIADRFGVSVGAVGLICRRTNWRHIA